MVILWYMNMVIIQYYTIIIPWYNITVTWIPWYCLNHLKLSGLVVASLHSYHAEFRLLLLSIKWIVNAKIYINSIIVFTYFYITFMVLFKLEASVTLILLACKTTANSDLCCMEEQNKQVWKDIMVNKIMIDLLGQFYCFFGTRLAWIYTQWTAWCIIDMIYRWCNSSQLHVCCHFLMKSCRPDVWRWIIY